MNTVQEGEDGGQQEIIDLQGELTRPQLELIVQNALQTPEQDSEGLLSRVAERYRRWAHLAQRLSCSVQPGAGS